MNIPTGITTTDMHAIITGALTVIIGLIAVIYKGIAKRLSGCEVDLKGIIPKLAEIETHLKDISAFCKLCSENAANREREV